MILENKTTKIHNDIAPEVIEALAYLENNSFKFYLTISWNCSKQERQLNKKNKEIYLRVGGPCWKLLEK
jgi:hypothetical protein